MEEFESRISESIRFYESHLSEEAIAECRKQTNEKDYVGMLIEEYLKNFKPQK